MGLLVLAFGIETCEAARAGNSTTHLQVIFFRIRATYLPYVLAFISFLMGGNIKDHLMGIIVGHTCPVSCAEIWCASRLSLRRFL